jgi:concanavalin A-like lectin/glucanase superfamily protein
MAAPPSDPPQRPDPRGRPAGPRGPAGAGAVRRWAVRRWAVRPWAVRPWAVRRWAVRLVGVAALVVGVFTAAYLIRGDAPEPQESPAAEPPPARASQSGAVSADPGVAATPSRPVGGGLAVRYRFDGGLTAPVPDEARHLPLKTSAAAGGVLTAEPRAGGLAVRFPKPCNVYGGRSCPRAILESGPADALNPGFGPFQWGASVRLGEDETAKGENVVQKGYSQGDSQFKLQVDGEDGRPSCVLVGTAAPEIHVLTADRSVADGKWHALECARNGGSVTISIDGAVSGRQDVPSALSITNREPLRIGGKGTSPNNDQFHGAIDDVFVTLGA